MDKPVGYSGAGQSKDPYVASDQERAGGRSGTIKEEDQAGRLLCCVRHGGNDPSSLLGLLSFGKVLEDNAFGIGGAGGDPAGVM